MQTQRKHEERAGEATEPTDVVARAVVPGLESEISIAASPALSLQQRLAEEWKPAADAPYAPRWAPRATLALAGGVSLLLWGAIAAVVAGFR